MRSEAIVFKKRDALRYTWKLRLFPIIFRNSQIICEKKMFYKFAINLFLIGPITKIRYRIKILNTFLSRLENLRFCSRFHVSWPNGIVTYTLSL